jgi:hypothetical protein
MDHLQSMVFANNKRQAELARAIKQLDAAPPAVRQALDLVFQESGAELLVNVAEPLGLVP